MAHQPNHLIERAAALLQASRAFHPNDAAGEPSSQAPAGAPPAPMFAPLLPTLASPPQAVPSPTLANIAARSDQQALPGQNGSTSPVARTGTRVPATPASAVAPLTSRPVAPRPASLRPPANEEPVSSLLPVIGLDAMERAGMVVARTARTRISEEYRIVIGRVLRALRDEPEGAGMHNVVMVTSARPGEGKSFTALNLAGSIAQHTTEKVLLVDLDAKLRPISALLGIDGRLGFHDLVTDPTLRLEDVILSTAVGNLTILPVGSRSVEDTAVAHTRPIPPTITRLARRFPKHVIMLDAPPCLSTSDPHTVAPFVGQVVMVVEAERTQRSEVEAALDLVRVCPTVTMLLNKVKLTTSHTFGAYDYYGSYS